MKSNTTHTTKLFCVLFLGLITFASNAQEVKWLSWSEASKLAETDKNPKKIFIDIYTDWCGWCKKMDKETFAQKDICDYINKNYHAIKFDAGTTNDIELKGKVYKYIKTNKGGYHELASEIMFGKLSYPTIVFMDEKFNILQPIPGYKDPQSLDKIMKYFAEDYYKSTPWKKYEEMYNQSAPKPVPAKGNGE